jgi:cytochrome P450
MEEPKQRATMKHFCPAYPRPKTRKLSMLGLFFSARTSWMDALSVRAYRMKMGEVHLPGLDLYMVNEPARVRQVLVDEAERFPKSELLGQALEPLLGQSIFTTNGAQWQRQRSMMNPAFAQARVNVAFAAMWAATQDMLERLDALPDGAVHDMELEMTHVTADIIFRTIFSKPMAGADAHRVFDAFARFQALAPRLMLPSLFGLKWLVWPWDARRSQRAAQDIRALLAELIRPRHEAFLRGQTGDAPSDILSAFMQARDPDTGRPFAFEELVNQVAMLFLAGHETSASALSWASHLLANAPDIQERMHAEQAQVLAGREPRHSDMKALELTWRVFKETLRLFPPVGFFSRQTQEACPMRDKQLPKGASVVVSPWLIQRHHDIWAEPDAFNPDRYLDDASRDALRDGYLPFGMGPRVCLGAAFAQQEGALILSAMVRRFRLAPVPGHVPKPVGRLTIRSANGVLVQVWKRDAEGGAA